MPDLSVDDGSLRRMLTHLAEQPGIEGFLINGHAGENVTMAPKDQLQVARTAMETVGERCRIMAGVNIEGDEAAAAHAAALERLGVHSVLVFPPTNASGISDTKTAVAHHRAIIDATTMPVLLFQAAIHTADLAYSHETLAALVQLPRVVGIKEGSWEVATYEANRRLVKSIAPDVTVMGSGDEHLFTSACIGSDGAIVSLASVTPEPIVRMLAAVDAGDLAMARIWHDRIYPIALAIYEDPLTNRTTAKLKACLLAQGLIDHDDLLPPAFVATAEERERLAVALEDATAEPPSQ
jgi:4-hydroxy-tetrahydrodipicolinate synthase